VSAVEPSNGELARRLEAVHQDLKDDFREVVRRLDSKVSVERYQLEKEATADRERHLVERIRAIEEAREKEAQDRQVAEQRAADRRASDRRMIFTALIAPVLMLLLTLYLSSRGAGA
jgi:hypothetical protein